MINFVGIDDPMMHGMRMRDVDGMECVTLTVVARSVNLNNDALGNAKTWFVDDMKRVHRLEW